MDSNRLKALRVLDYETIVNFFDNPVMKKEIYEDGASFTFPDILNEYWIGVIKERMVIGLYRIHPYGAVMWQLHARVLPEYRNEHALECSKKVLLWAVENIPRLEKILCYIPTCHRNVILHARQTGLQREGIIKKSYLKNGTIVDQHIYTISADNIRGIYASGSGSSWDSSGSGDKVRVGQKGSQHTGQSIR